MHRSAFHYQFPEHFPPFDTFQVNNQKIYVFTHIVKKDKRQLLVFDFNGNLQREVFIKDPPDRRGIIYSGRHYYLVDNPDQESWELHRQNIDFKPGGIKMDRKTKIE
jgi:hypothetical protein